MIVRLASSSAAPLCRRCVSVTIDTAPFDHRSLGDVLAGARLFRMNAPDTLTAFRGPSANIATRAPRDDELVALPLIRQWIAFDTTSRESNLALIDWTRAYLESYGALTSLTYDDDRRKANLFATLPARDGNATMNGIVLSGHTDVVPVDGQPWDTPPFEATVK